jgi:hypothetical protein
VRDVKRALITSDAGALKRHLSELTVIQGEVSELLRTATLDEAVRRFIAVAAQDAGSD